MKSTSKEKIISIGETSKVAIVYRYRSEKAVKTAKQVTKWLQDRNVTVYTASGQKLIAKTKYIRGKKMISTLSFVIVLGGDGTYLRAIRLIDGLQIPVLGINMGSLGFLTSTPANKVFEALNTVLQDKAKIHRRMLLQAKVYRKRKLKISAIALNDVVIERGSFSQLINISISKEKKLVSEIKADALIISSPTGSTAYNLAAGGPLLDPEVNALIITPVAAHALTSRPLIFPANRKLHFRMEGGTQKANIIIDGQEALALTPDDEIVVEQASSDHLMIEPNHADFFHLLREKLKFGDRA